MRFYKALLRLYPSSFRSEYGEELVRIFQQKRRLISGPLAVLLFWIQEIADVLVHAMLTHWDIFVHDLRYSFRAISRTPGFAATAILIAALGIGANTAVFSVVNHVLIRPLPYQDPDRILRIWERTPEYGRLEVSPPNYRDWKERNTSFESMAAYTGISMNLVGNGIPERADGAAVRSDLFPLLGVKPVIGRLFTASEDRNGAPWTVLLSFGLWQSRFGGDPRAIGKSIRLNDESYTIIGVLPQDTYFPTQKTRFWIPMRFLPEQGDDDRTNFYLKVLGRLKPQVTMEQARSEMNSITEQLEREYPQENARTRANVESLRGGVPQQTRLLLIALLGASACVLLIACTNLANLFLVRAMARKKELAVRAALGAGRDRLLRQMLTESLVFALIGGLLGVALANVSLPLLSRLIPESLPTGKATVLDIRVLGFATVLLCVTAIVCGVVPSLRAGKDPESTGLREGSRSGIGGKKERVRSVLVIAEICASVALLIASGLLIRALWRIQSVDPGFHAENVLTLQTPLPIPKYNSVERRANFYSRVLERSRALPGVTNVAFISFLPLDFGGGIWPVESVDGVVAKPGEAESASLRFVTPGFFQTMKIPLQRGRDVRESDTKNTQMVAVVSESFARTYLPGKNPIGHSFKTAFYDRTIVGVVGDIRVRGLERKSEPQVYLPYRQVDDGGLIFYVPRALVIRSSADTATLIRSVRKIVQNIDSEMPVTDVRTLQDVVDTNTAARQTQIRIIVAFAFLSLLLAGIGIHGLLSFAVSQRAPEIGLRIALGAQSNDILRMILTSGFEVAAAGCGLGLLLGYFAARTMEAVLAGVKPDDALTFVFAIAVVTFTVISGSLAPAFRAIKIDPVKVMRAE
jgi:predicted permease